MPYGASASLVSGTAGAKQFRPATTHLRLSKPVSFNSRTCLKPQLDIGGLMQRGYHDFALSNGAEARIVYTEVGTGYYLGFALKNIKDDGYTIYGRVAFDYHVNEAGELLVKEGDITSQEYKHPDECVELFNTMGTPVYISSGVRQGYGGIGTVLMRLAMRVAREKKAAKLIIEQSVANGFYEQLGFVRQGEVTEENKDDIACFSLDLGGDIVEDSAFQIIPRRRIDAGWRPREKNLTADDSLIMRLKESLFGWLRPEKAVAKPSRA